VRSQHALLRKGIVLCLQCGDKFIELNINEEDVRTRQVGDNGIRQQNIYVFSLLATLYDPFTDWMKNSIYPIWYKNK